ncbi:hypothetical protein CPB83DRAFT_841160 [Crepidotus variabilis]|uniref:Uncharacterized protein n=1 Tax=Crepidotus variabilis TaxID=179855 RepID=A0A9P6JHX4_9AGAR|nr:hypothetical protein CPB83DRAFT_841160 [Crepidotus variabilis]
MMICQDQFFALHIILATPWLSRIPLPSYALDTVANSSRMEEFSVTPNNNSSSSTISVVGELHVESADVPMDGVLISGNESFPQSHLDGAPRMRTISGPTATSEILIEGFVKMRQALMELMESRATFESHLGDFVAETFVHATNVVQAGDSYVANFSAGFLNSCVDMILDKSDKHEVFLYEDFVNLFRAHEVPLPGESVIEPNSQTPPTPQTTIPPNGPSPLPISPYTVDPPQGSAMPDLPVVGPGINPLLGGLTLGVVVQSFTTADPKTLSLSSIPELASALDCPPQPASPPSTSLPALAPAVNVSVSGSNVGPALVPPLQTSGPAVGVPGPPLILPDQGLQTSLPPPSENGPPLASILAENQPGSESYQVTSLSPPAGATTIKSALSLSLPSSTPNFIADIQATDVNGKPMINGSDEDADGETDKEIGDGTQVDKPRDFQQEVLLTKDDAATRGSRKRKRTKSNAYVEMSDNEEGVDGGRDDTKIDADYEEEAEEENGDKSKARRGQPPRKPIGTLASVKQAKSLATTTRRKKPKNKVPLKTLVNWKQEAKQRCYKIATKKKGTSCLRCRTGRGGNCSHTKQHKADLNSWEEEMEESIENETDDEAAPVHRSRGQKRRKILNEPTQPSNSPAPEPSMKQRPNVPQGGSSNGQVPSNHIYKPNNRSSTGSGSDLSKVPLARDRDRWTNVGPPAMFSDATIDHEINSRLAAIELEQKTAKAERKTMEEKARQIEENQREFQNKQKEQQQAQNSLQNYVVKRFAHHEQEQERLRSSVESLGQRVDTRFDNLGQTMERVLEAVTRPGHWPQYQYSGHRPEDLGARVTFGGFPVQSSNMNHSGGPEIGKGDEPGFTLNEYGKKSVYPPATPQAASPPRQGHHNLPPISALLPPYPRSPMRLNLPNTMSPLSPVHAYSTPSRPMTSPTEMANIQTVLLDPPTLPEQSTAQEKSQISRLTSKAGNDMKKSGKVSKDQPHMATIGSGHGVPEAVKV